jgi:hypothetical protein
MPATGKRKKKYIGLQHETRNPKLQLSRSHRPQKTIQKQQQHNNATNNSSWYKP